MDWNTIIGKLPDAVAGDDGINALIFGVAEHWGYPLVGAAYNEFDRRSKTDYVGDTDTAIALARDVLGNVSLEMRVATDGVAVVKMRAKPEWPDATPQEIEADGKTLPLAIVRAVAEIMSRTSGNGACSGAVVT